MFVSIDSVHRDPVCRNYTCIGVVAQYIQAFAYEPVVADIVSARQFFDFTPVACECYIDIPCKVLVAYNSEVDAQLNTGVLNRADVGCQAAFSGFQRHCRFHDLSVGKAAISICRYIDPVLQYGKVHTEVEFLDFLPHQGLVNDSVTVITLEFITADYSIRRSRCVIARSIISYIIVTGNTIGQAKFQIIQPFHIF